MDRRFAVGLFYMNEIFRARLALVAPLVASGLLVSGCMSSPTYGTAKTANEQLVDDVNGILSLAPKNRNQIDYKPRPELVKPASTAVLPAPQENIASASGAAWPESPEQKRARVRADATANRDNPGFEPLIVDDLSPAREKRQPGVSQRLIDDGAVIQQNLERKQQREEFNRRLAENNQGSPTTRKYLSEPPLEYRKPAETAAANDVGEDELKKQRRIKKAAQKQGTGGWRDMVPWL
jgi:hypothetical protein